MVELADELNNQGHRTKVQNRVSGPHRGGCVLATRKAPGKASILNDEQRACLAEQVEAGPIPAAHGVVRWRLVDLGQWIWDEFGLSAK